MKNLILVSATLALAACGGGGGGGGGGVALPLTVAPAAPVAAAPAPAPSSNTLQTDVPASTYSAGSGEAAAFAYLQTARSNCGFGALSQNTKLDAAALAHSKYLIAAGTATTVVVGHGELDKANPFYTGAAPSDRASFTGYGENVTEDLSAYSEFYGDKSTATLPSLSTRGSNAMRGLLNTVSHLSGAMSAGREVGFGSDIKETENISGGITSLKIDYRFGLLVGSQGGTQLLGAGSVATYPCAQSSDIDFSFSPATEAPNPFPEIVDPLVKVGPPIYIRADEGSLLAVSSYNLKNAAGEEIAVRKDVGSIGQHEFFMVPRSALQPNEAYTAKFEGTSNGKNFSSSITFKTRAN